MDFGKNTYSGVYSAYGSNPVTGIIGALIGACIGVVVWVAIYHFGFIAAIGGYVIAAGALKGYEILGGSLDVKGIVFSVIIFLFMVFVACYLSWAMEFYSVLNEYEPWTMGEVITSMPSLLVEIECVGDFVKDLVVGYLLSIIGAGSMIKSKFNNA